MSYKVVEFDPDGGGGIGIVRDTWLTPRKKESFWPPYKMYSKYNRCLTDNIQPGEDWMVYKLKRIFTSTGLYIHIYFSCYYYKKKLCWDRVILYFNFLKRPYKKVNMLSIAIVVDTWTNTCISVSPSLEGAFRSRFEKARLDFVTRSTLVSVPSLVPTHY